MEQELRVRAAAIFTRTAVASWLPYELNQLLASRGLTEVRVCGNEQRRSDVTKQLMSNI